MGEPYCASLTPGKTILRLANQFCDWTGFNDVCFILKQLTINAVFFKESHLQSVNCKQTQAQKL